jgi:hypothetical protein
MPEHTFKYDTYHDRYILFDDFSSWFKINERYADKDDWWAITCSYGFSERVNNLTLARRFKSEQEVMNYLKSILKDFGYNVIDKSLNCFY